MKVVAQWVKGNIVSVLQQDGNVITTVSDVGITRPL